MKTKVPLILLASCLLAVAAWSVQGPDRLQNDEVPEKYRETVSKGLEYLAKTQCKDGHWEGDAGKHPVAMTALAGMALLMEGSNVHKGKYAANLRKAADWLMDRSQAGRDGLIFSDHASETNRYMQGHGLATLFLAWAYGNEIDKVRRERLKGILTRAAKYIASAQSSQGGWYPTSRVEGHDLDEILVTAMQIQALYTAGILGIPIAWDTVKDGQVYLKTTLEKRKEGPGSAQNPARQADIAAALACRSCPDANGYDQQCTKWFKECQTEIPVGSGVRFGRDELAHYFYAQAIFNRLLSSNERRDIDAEWGKYRTAMFDHLQSSQNQDGSWPAGNGISVGPVYATALWCTILQLDKKNHPLTRQRLVASF